MVALAKPTLTQDLLRGLPLDVARAIGARTALRCLPLSVRAFDSPAQGWDESRVRNQIVLPTFRAVCASWFLTAFPKMADKARGAMLHASQDLEDARSASGNPTYGTANELGDAVASAGRRDVSALQGRDAGALAADPIWQGDMPAWAQAAWERLKTHLHESNESWEVWTRWYEARLAGETPVADHELQAMLVDQVYWQQGAKSVNAILKIMRGL